MFDFDLQKMLLQGPGLWKKWDGHWGWQKAVAPVLDKPAFQILHDC